ncbi:hypothetical protein QLX08_004367 [Tetragonisca angustula]|uniref:DUF7041 domain-containing protein n=1 Tax=Tetragonisca angustula TaxID=166442 RepID=A0AAW1A2E5_9HYME
MAKINSDATKYLFLLSQLRPDKLKYVVDVVDTPPATDKYNALKQRLLELYSETEELKYRQLLKMCRVGDEKPSHSSCTA